MVFPKGQDSPLPAASLKGGRPICRVAMPFPIPATSSSASNRTVELEKLRRELLRRIVENENRRQAQRRASDKHEA